MDVFPHWLPITMYVTYRQTEARFREHPTRRNRREFVRLSLSVRRHCRRQTHPRRFALHWVELTRP